MKIRLKSIKQFKLLGVVLLALGLTACAKAPKPLQYVAVHKSTLQSYRANLQAELTAEGGVQVIHTGEQIRVVIRSDYLFNPSSANLIANYKPVLRNVAKLIRTYQKINVKVAAYTDNVGNTAYLRALTTRQAQVVANFLWQQGIDARLLYAVGYNKLNPVGWNGAVLGRSDNRRVEISFRYIPNYKSYN